MVLALATRLDPRDHFGGNRFPDARGRKPARQHQGAALLRLYLAAPPALLAIKRQPLAVLTVLSIIFLGVALECAQKLVPGKESEICDIINGFGVLIALGILQRRIVPAVSRS